MDVARLRKTVLSRYSTEEDVEAYARRSMDGLRNWEKKVIERFMSPDRVLTIGCGGGRESFALEALGYAVYGLDISARQIDSANRKGRRLGSHANFLVYDGCHIPFQDNCFLAGTMWSQILGNVPGSAERLNLLRESLRVLSTDGTLSISVHDRGRTMRLIQEKGIQYEELSQGDPGDLLCATGAGVYWALLHTGRAQKPV